MPDKSLETSRRGFIATTAAATFVSSAVAGSLTLFPTQAAVATEETIIRPFNINIPERPSPTSNVA